jgi:hypothetical protein
MKSWRKVWWIAFHAGYWQGYYKGRADGYEEIQDARDDYNAEIMAGIQYDIWREQRAAMKKGGNVEVAG